MTRSRARVRVEGIVQGVGFRPFVFTLADGLGLDGWVGNDTRGVSIEVEGKEQAVGRFVAALETEAPPLAVVERVVVEEIEATGEAGARDRMGREARAGS
jgi:hydrogenase maturation protein HypF